MLKRHIVYSVYPYTRYREQAFHMGFLSARSEKAHCRQYGIFTFLFFTNP